MTVAKISTLKRDDDASLLEAIDAFVERNRGSRDTARRELANLLEACGEALLSSALAVTQHPTGAKKQDLQTLWVAEVAAALSRRSRRDRAVVTTLHRAIDGSASQAETARIIHRIISETGGAWLPALTRATMVRARLARLLPSRHAQRLPSVDDLERSFQVTRRGPRAHTRVIADALGIDADTVKAGLKRAKR